MKELNNVKSLTIATIVLGLVTCCDTKTGQINEEPSSDGAATVIDMITTSSDTWRLLPSSASLTLQLPSDVSNSSNLMFAFFDKNGKSFLSYCNKPKKEIILFDTQNRSIHSRITLTNDSNNRIPAISGFHVHSLDSIYVCPGRKRVIYLINSKGSIIQTITYSNEEFEEYSFNAPIPLTSSTSYANLEFIGTKIYLISPLDGNWNLISENDIGKRRICFELDTLTSHGRFSEMTFPSDYWAKARAEPVFSRVLADSQFVYSFFGDHSIYATSDHVSVRRYPAKSAYFNEIKPPKEKENPSMEEYLTHYCETPAYTNLLYDRFANVYYRITSLGSKVTASTNLQNLASYPENVSIMILDSAFNKMGEAVFKDNKKYAFGNSFVLEDGLYVSTGNPGNNERNENVLNFVKFQLVKNDEALQ